MSQLGVVERIYHIGDIHIRNVQRHDEYKQIFNKFYAEVKKRGTENALIYIAGDLAHSKTDMSPELVELISEFLTDCGNLCPTLIIPGNHDLNLSNKTRQDVLTPIVSFLVTDHPLIYLKESCIIESDEFNFIHYSILDTTENWPTPPSNGKTNIGLFHGPIHDATTDVGYIISNPSITPEVFAGCDLVMCGDIHKRQVITTNPIVVFCGSMIQQNHAEPIDNHGFIEWTFEGGEADANFVDIPNDYGYYTLNIDDGIVPVVENMPKHPRLRIRVSNTPSSQVQLALAEVRKLYKVQEFTVTRIDTISKTKSGDREDKFEIGDVSDVDYQNTLIRDYLDRQFSLDDSILAKISAINSEVNTRIQDDSVNNIVWKPIRLEFSNMFSYGPDNYIDFEPMRGIHGIFAANASGKSSVFDALSFCLFDKCSRAYRAAHIMNNRKTTFRCKLEFEINDVRYFIERTAYERKGAVKVNVDFWRMVGDERENLNGDQRRATNEAIRQYIGSYDDFILTTLSLQNHNSAFIDLSQSERKDLLGQFMGINIFDKLHSRAVEDVRDMTAIIRKMKKDNLGLRLAEVAEQVEEYKKLHETSKAKAKILESKKESAVRSRTNLATKIVDISSEIEDVDALMETLKALELGLDSLDVQDKDTDTQFTTLTAKQEEINEALGLLNADGIEKRYLKLIDIKKQLDTLDPQIQNVASEIDNKSEHLLHYSDIEHDADCVFCVKNAKKFETTAFDLKESLTTLETEITKLIEKRRIFHDHVKLNAKAVEQYNDLQEKIKTQRDIELRLALASTDRANQELKRQRLNTKILNTKSNILEHHKMKDTIQKNKTLQGEVSEWDRTIASLTTEIREAHQDRMNTYGTLASATSQHDSLTKQIEDLAKFEADYKVYEYYIDAVKRDGVPYELIAKAVPVIEGEVNNILQQIVDFGMIIDLDGKNINTKITYADGKEWPLEMSSGMERFVSGLALRVGLNNVCNLPHTNFLVIDEGLGTLDRNNLSSIFLLFDYLKTQYDFVILISHLDSARDVVDTLIEITKDGDGYSSLTFG